MEILCPMSVQAEIPATIVRTCPKFLALLGAFYEDRPEAPPTRAELIDPSQIPEPFRRLLVHKSDMTSTLEKYHGEPLDCWSWTARSATDSCSGTLSWRGEKRGSRWSTGRSASR